MKPKRSSLKPLEAANRSFRRRLKLPGEFLLALLATARVLTALALVEVMSRQRLLFASLASSSFLIYLDPQDGTNAVRTLVTSHMMAATIGWLTYLIVGPGSPSAGAAMVITIVLIILLYLLKVTSLGIAIGALWEVAEWT
ncbi:MAG: HPP family protein, partial [Cyanobacteria bacterium 0813]|nr:HPP family protein [Cyanobacteria bacterium 0813]